MSPSVAGNPSELDRLVTDHSATLFEWSVTVYDTWVPGFDPSDPITFSPDLLWYLLIAGFVGLVLLGMFALLVLLLS